MAAGDPLRGAASTHLSTTRLISPLLGCACATDYRGVSGAKSPGAATPRFFRCPICSGQFLAGLPSRLLERVHLVRRHLLLDLRSYASVRRTGSTRWCWCSDPLLPLPRSLQRILRRAACSFCRSRPIVKPACSYVGTLPLGGCRVGAYPHHGVPVGVVGNRAGRQHSSLSLRHRGRGVRPLLRDPPRQHSGRDCVPGSPGETFQAAAGRRLCRCGPASRTMDSRASGFCRPCCRAGAVSYTHLTLPTILRV